MTDNEAEQYIKEVIHNVLHAVYEMDSNDAGEAANSIYEGIWEYVKDFD